MSDQFLSRDTAIKMVTTSLSVAGQGLTLAELTAKWALQHDDPEDVLAFQFQQVRAYIYAARNGNALTT
jgi:hypothetical protein